jgi:hypothetical protein
MREGDKTHLKDKEFFGGLDVDARMILKWNSENYGVRQLIGVSFFWIWSTGSFL